MKVTQRACVVLSDYPIKTMAYQRFLSTLGEGLVVAFRSTGENFDDLSGAKLLVCDMNIMSEYEPETLARLEIIFPKANILFLEEDHSDMLVRFSNQRDICRLGKLAEINIIHSTLKELLLQTNRKDKRSARLRRERVEQT
jgi:hypothetical protein